MVLLGIKFHRVAYMLTFFYCNNWCVYFCPTWFFLTIKCCWDQYSWKQIQIRHPYTVFTNGGLAGKSEALEDKQKLQMKTFSELAECLARIPRKITLYGRLFKYNDVGRLLLLMFSTDLLFAIKRDAYIFKETGWFCRFPKHQKLDKWAMAGEKRQTCWPKLHIETEFESQLTAIR